MTENETVGWHHQLNGHEFEQTQGDSPFRTGKPGMLKFMSQRVRYDLAIEQQQQVFILYTTSLYAFIP